MIEEALVLNKLWEWALDRVRQRGHPYDFVCLQETQAYVRSYR